MMLTTSGALPLCRNLDLRCYLRELGHTRQRPPPWLQSTTCTSGMTIKGEIWRAKQAARIKAWREANQAHIKAYRRQYYLSHRNAILSCQNVRRKADPEARRVYEAAWRERNREKLRAYKQAWRERNRERLREYEAKRRATEPSRP